MSKMKFVNRASAVALAASALFISGVASAQDNAMKPPSLIQQNMGNISTPSTIGQTIQDAWTLGKLETMIEFSGLNSVLGTENFTVFAPRDSAFWQVDNREYEEIMSDSSLAKEVVLSHVIPGRINSTDLVAEINSSASGSVSKTTVGGQTLTFVLAGKYVQVIDGKGNRAEVTRADIVKSDGVIHVMNSVLNTGPGTDNS